MTALRQGLKQDREKLAHNFGGAQSHKQPYSFKTVPADKVNQYSNSWKKKIDSQVQFVLRP